MTSLGSAAIALLMMCWLVGLSLGNPLAGLIGGAVAIVLLVILLGG
jgi:hypothetical protein